MTNSQCVNEQAHRSKLEGIADRVDLLDDFTPQEYYSLPAGDQHTVDQMVGERMAEERKPRLQVLQKPWDYAFS